MSDDSTQQRAELDQLQSELATRMSITHFAKTAISTMVALILSGGVAKLIVDSAKLPFLAMAGIAAVVGLVLFAVVQYVRGRKAQVYEDTRYARMMELRQALHLDDPAMLLPG